MADLSASRASAVASHVAAAPKVAVADLGALPPRTRFVFRGREAAITAAGPAFGVALPREACRFAEAGDRRVLWLGPDEWLLTAPEGAGAAIVADLAAALAGLPHSLVDVSHRSLGIAVSGAMAARVINNGCPLDLGLEAFPVGMATRTVFGKAEIVLVRTAEMRFEIDVWRSFADYVWRFLEEARREFA
ncbi:sarcosine oxidase subunit gamma [Methylobrevis albus]|uniref:Sarcosine oxidase subunit gamma family protein n=1 Tax=Methylobrevis albus TaxID=2793297 RepID=A0A931I0Z2_9HYPH|nr:sarcosine oxidase subunit gamma family protein [Methylobrevis albus]MBH0237424.1 sarcosine oxidase subunit gamma family protein [Methylobrevis albus]